MIQKNTRNVIYAIYQNLFEPTKENPNMEENPC